MYDIGKYFKLHVVSYVAELKQLLRSLLAYKPMDRMADWCKVINHPWMQSKQLKCDADVKANGDKPTMPMSTRAIEK